jgi:CHAT domain-containing protein/Tfp pilus assembly protein PilF
MPGVVVEFVLKNSEAEKAGLAEGDVILRWTQGDAKGEIGSPFELSEIEMEQEPRGRVMLEGIRGGTKQTWLIGPDKWGIQARPSLPGSLLAFYREGQELAKTGNVSEAAERWRSAANSQIYQCSWFRTWLLFHAGEVLADGQQWTKSDALYQEAIEQASEARPEVKGELLRNWADTFHQRGDLVNAEKYYRHAELESQKAGRENLTTASNLNELGATVRERGDLNKAEEYLGQALQIERKLAPTSVAVAKSLNNLGDAADDRGDVAKAEEYYDQALAIDERLAPGSLGVATNLNNLGNVAYERGDLVKAGEYFGQALEIREQLAPDSLYVASTLDNLGNVADDRGDLADAEEYHRQGLMIRERLAPDSVGVAASLNNLGNVAYDRGDLAKAEEYYRQALAIDEKLAPDSVGVATDLNNLGDVAHDRGDLTGAEEYYRQALAISENAAPGSLAVAMNLNNLGDVAFRRGDLAKAGDYYHQAFVIRVKLAPSSLSVASSLSHLGDVARDRGDLAKAEKYFHQALVIDEKVAPGSLASARDLCSLGIVASHRGNVAKSEEYYRQGLEIRKKLAPDSADYAESLAAVAGIMRDKQEAAEAAQLYELAIDVLDSQLAHLGGSSDIRAGFRAKHAEYYLDYAALLLKQNKPELAFQVLERSRARTLLEALTEAHVDIRQGANPAMLERERMLQATLTAKSNRKINLMEGKHTDEQVAAFNKAIDELVSQYREIEGRIRILSPNYAALTQPRPLSAKDVQQQLLDADTALLIYALGEKHSFVFVVTPTSLDSYELQKRSKIEDVAHRAYDLLTSRNRWIKGESSLQRKNRLAKSEAEYEKTAATLSQMIIAPVAAQLGRKRLLIVADGTLQYIPFAILPVPAGDVSKPAMPLIAEHEIVNLPSASVLALLRRQANGRAFGAKEVAVFADPVFDKDDSRVTKAAKSKQDVVLASKEKMILSFPYQLTRSLDDVGLGTRQTGVALQRLAFSRQEADSIMAMTSPGKGMEARDFMASRETALSNDLGQYRIVHFATHGLLDNEHPELSGLVLSLVDQEGKPKDGFLDLEDVYNLTLPSDLVVLSACETGLGKQITGEGLVGLTRGFMYAGATRVVASLWRVDDAATAELMKGFYRGMLKEGLPPAASLRQAQLEMWKDKRWHDPYYWAAFTIQGEWK